MTYYDITPRDKKKTGKKKYIAKKTRESREMEKTKAKGKNKKKS